MVYGQLKHIVDVSVNPEGKIIIITKNNGKLTTYRCLANKDALNDIIMFNKLLLNDEFYEIEKNWYTTKTNDTILDIPENLELTPANYPMPSSVEWFYLY